MNADYYEILGVDKSATKEEIKKAYRTLSKKYHPDVNDADNAAVFFRLLEEAYHALYNDNSQSAYDQPHQAPTQTTYQEKNENDPSKDDSDINPDHYTRRSRGIFSSILRVFSKIILFPVFVLLAFLSKVFLLIGGLTVVVGWIILGIGVLMCVISLFQKAEWLMIGISVMIAFGGFLITNLASIILAGIERAKDTISCFIFS